MWWCGVRELYGHIQSLSPLCKSYDNNAAQLITSQQASTTGAVTCQQFTKEQSKWLVMPEPTRGIKRRQLLFVVETVNRDVLARKPQYCDVTTARWLPTGSNDYIVHALS